VDVHDDHRRGRACLLDELVDDLPHALRGVEVERAEDVDHGDGSPVARLDDGQPAARRIALEVRRADDRRRRRQVGADLVPSPRVVAER